jgi:glucosamine 6-phosphate synthetase-like amidotransferase/phosphosugar isomerase protein
MAGELTREAVFAQPDWLRALRVEERLPAGRILHTGCGTSYHAALTGGLAVQALDLVLGRAPEADVLVAVSHEGETQMTLEAVEAFAGETWLVTGAPDSRLARAVDRVVVATPALERSWCHTASYTCAVAALDALHGADVAWLADAVAEVLAGERFPATGHERWLVTGAGRDWPTALEAVLKLREGCHVAANALHLEQLLHGHLAAIDERVRAFVLEGEGRAAERAAQAVAALRALGADATLVPTRHPAVDIVRFHLLMLDLAELRGVDPDPIRRDQPRWRAAAAAHGNDAEPPRAT